jgi:benzoyl-CoA reductase/2-hydroxyglutaryl-CoA dehydratase subunit BcrC/BadD/HgdB
VSESIGITATIPVEIPLAAGLRPVDLNNLFITSQKAKALVADAESAGFSHNICAWIKGIYTAVLESDIKRVIAVTGGDCSNTIALGEVLASKGIQVLHFEYPLSRDRSSLEAQMERLMGALGTSWDATKEVRERLGRIRRKLARLDEMTYRTHQVTGTENHIFLVSSSDFGGDPNRFEHGLDQFLAEASGRPPRAPGVRLGYAGVPPIFSEFYEFIESVGARVVFNEVQRQFSMPYAEGDLVEQYLFYTYPYAIGGRIQDIQQAMAARELDGLIHYTQTFCYRQIYDILLRDALPIPILTLEGDRPGPLDGRSALRIETFVEMLREKKGD